MCMICKCNFEIEILYISMYYITGYATIFRGSGVFHRGTGANYKRIIFVKTMEFKNVSILDKTDALFSTQYSDSVDLLSQHLVGKFKRLEEQVEYIRNHPDQAQKMVEIGKYQNIAPKM